ncbi:MAG: hypothetical protein MJ048_03970 [Acidaminococcaceae bacterium]|nr:hypothetical protein [Acidaminococcaceae bacterium]
MIKTKQILIALAVIGANVLHNMPVHTALAAEGDIRWYGTTGGFVDAIPSPAVTTGINLTITDSTQVNGKTVADVNKEIYGGYTGGSEAVKNNSITFNTTNAVTTAAYIYGADTDSGDASGNSVNIKNGTFSGDIYGSKIHNSSTTGTATKNSVNIADGTFSGKIYGGNNNASTATKNSVVIDGGTFSNTIYGAQGAGVDGNSVTINKGTFKTDVFGGNASVDGTDATNNTVTINNGVFDVNNKYVYGGVSAGGDVTGNKVIINDGQFTGTNILAGRKDKYTGNATGNTVTIKGGTFSDITIYGIISLTGNVTGNTVNIEGGTFNTIKKLYGGYVGATGTSTNNTLNLKTVIGGTAAEVKYFQNVNFTLPEGATSEVTMLKVGSTGMALGGITFTTDLNGLSLTETGDYVTLIKNVDDSSFTPATSGLGHYILTIGGVNELVYSNGTPVAKGDYTIKQGSNKFDSGTTGNYTVQINGNTTDGGLSATSYSGNEIIIRRGEYAPAVGNVAVAGAYNGTADAINNNTVKIYDGTFKGNIYGGHSTYGEVSGNTVNIYGGTLGVSPNPINIYGGYSNTNNVTGNVTNIEGGTFASGAYIRGGGSNSGNATKNTLTINGGTFSGENNIFMAVKAVTVTPAGIAGKRATR